MAAWPRCFWNSRAGRYLLPGYPGRKTGADAAGYELAGVAAEINREQIAIFSKLLPAGRAAIGTSISDSAREVVAYRIAQENPGMSPEEANRRALQLAYGDVAVFLQR